MTPRSHHAARAARVAALALSAGLTLAACSGLEFKEDRRLTFSAPKAYALTGRPVTLTWSMTDYQTGSGEGQYAVFVDRSPMKVGQTLDSLLSLKTPPSQLVLNRAQIYTTTAPTITLTTVPDLQNDKDKRQTHAATVVLINAQGKRTNESAWTRYFDLPLLGNE